MQTAGLLGDGGGSNIPKLWVGDCGRIAANSAIEPLPSRCLEPGTSSVPVAVQERLRAILGDCVQKQPLPGSVKSFPIVNQR